jgi:hypothetical protein
VSGIYEKMVAGLTDTELCLLGGELGRTYEEVELSGLLLGIVLVEQAARFVMAHESNNPAHE